MIDYYRNQLEEAQQFQDWVMVELRNRGFIIQVFGSKAFQYKIGETPSHDEIKFDKEALKTPNLWIEFFEKTDPDNLEYVRTGMFRENVVRWIHGNYEWVYLFDKMRLLDYIVQEQKKGRFKLRENKRKTSLGVIFPQSEADRICSLKIRFNEPNLIKSVSIPKSCTDFGHGGDKPRQEKQLITWGIT